MALIEGFYCISNAKVTRKVNIYTVQIGAQLDEQWSEIDTSLQDYFLDQNVFGKSVTGKWPIT